MKSKTLKYIGGFTNCEIIHDADRKYPGVLLQGDTVYIILQKMKEARAGIENNSTSESREVINELIGQFEDLLTVYSETLMKNGFTALPY